MAVITERPVFFVLLLRCFDSCQGEKRNLNQLQQLLATLKAYLLEHFNKSELY